MRSAEPRRSEEKRRLALVCAWCGRRLTPPEEEEDTGPGVSHGICPECRERVVAEFRESIRQLPV